MALRSYWVGLSRKQRVCAVVALFCLINGIYSAFGAWRITFSGSGVYGNGELAEQRRGIFSYEGYLLIAASDSSFLIEGIPAAPLPVHRYILGPSIDAYFTPLRGPGPPWHKSLHFLGIIIATGQPGIGRYAKIYDKGIAIHWAYPTLAFAISPLFALIKLFRERRRCVGNHCRVCGYDLRASPEYCPECGTLTKSPRAVGS